jgi:3'-phosphoadenosine 5'-phosphosulfate synthase
MYMTAKMEVNKELPGNPITQDIKNGEPRFYTYGTTFFNYGLIPQTWEDPEMKSMGYGGGTVHGRSMMHVLILCFLRLFCVICCRQ